MKDTPLPVTRADVPLITKQAVRDRDSTNANLQASKAKWDPLDPKKVELAKLLQEELIGLRNQIASTLNPDFSTDPKHIGEIMQELWGHGVFVSLSERQRKLLYYALCYTLENL